MSAPHEHPIMFQPEKLRKILAMQPGDRMQTRRVIVRNQRAFPADRWWVGPHPGGGWWAVDAPEGPDWEPEGEGFPCPYGGPGDALWVKETWAELPEHVARRMEWKDVRYHEGRRAIYAVDFERRPEQLSRWSSPRFMPRWASRLLLPLVAVRAEPVQAISVEDVALEAVEIPVVKRPGGVSVLQSVSGKHPSVRYLDDKDKPSEESQIVAHFASLWDSLNAKRGYEWARNHWVWVLTFERTV